MKQFTLPKTERLYLRESIGELFANGRSFTAFPYKVVYLIKEETEESLADARQARCAIMTIASKKKFKHSVARNHVKRLTREAYRIQKLPLIAALEKNKRTLEAAFLYIDNKFLDFETTQRVIGKVVGRLEKAAASPL